MPKRAVSSLIDVGVTIVKPGAAQTGSVSHHRQPEHQRDVLGGPGTAAPGSGSVVCEGALACRPQLLRDVPGGRALTPAHERTVTVLLDEQLAVPAVEAVRD